jgi:hypothetical protein
VNPVVVHVVRPYQSEQEYLDAEAWSIDARTMVLLEVEPLAADTVVLFDVVLADGHKPIRAEGRVVAPVAPTGSRPGGLKVRFKRFGAATKAFIERAVAVKRSAQAERPSSPDVEQPSQTDAEQPSQTDAEQPSAPDAVAAPPPDGDRTSLTEVRTSAPDLDGAAALKDREPSGTRQRVPGPIVAPANRDELLARLRQRRRSA